MDCIIKNGRVVIPKAGIQEVDLAVHEGKIAAVLERGTPMDGAEVIDASGRYIFPGLIDPHVHWGCYQEMGADTRLESAAAAIGGYTTCLQYRRTPGEDASLSHGPPWFPTAGTTAQTVSFLQGSRRITGNLQH